MWQLLGIGIMALSAWGFIAAHDQNQQKIGAEKVRAEVAEARQKAAELDKQFAEQGEKDARAAADRAGKRAKAVAAQLVVANMQREADNEARAKVDPVFKKWSEELVPAYSADGLRQHAAAILAANTNRDRLPTQSGLEVAPATAGDTESINESWAQKLRRRVAGLVRGGVERGGQAGR